MEKLLFLFMFYYYNTHNLNKRYLILDRNLQSETKKNLDDVKFPIIYESDYSEPFLLVIINRKEGESEIKKAAFNDNINFSYTVNPSGYIYPLGPQIQSYIIQFNNLNKFEAEYYATVPFKDFPYDKIESKYQAIIKFCAVYIYHKNMRVWKRSKDNEVILVENPSNFIEKFSERNAMLKIFKSGTYGISCEKSSPFVSNYNRSLKFFSIILFIILLLVY